MSTVPSKYSQIDASIETFSAENIQTRYPISTYKIDSFDNFSRQLEKFSNMLQEFAYKTNEQISSIETPFELLNPKPNKDDCGKLRELIQDVCEIRIYFNNERKENIEPKIDISIDQMVRKINTGAVLFNQNVILNLAYIYFLFENPKVADQILTIYAREKGVSSDDLTILIKNFRTDLIYQLFNVKDIELLERAFEIESVKSEGRIKHTHQIALTGLIDETVDKSIITVPFKGTTKKAFNIRDLFLTQELCRSNKEKYDIISDYYLQALEEFIEQILFWKITKWNIETLPDIPLNDASKLAKAMVGQLPSSSTIIEVNADIIENSKIISKNIYKSKRWVNQV